MTQYAVTHEPDRRRLKTATVQQIFETRFRSPQLALWQPGIVDWRLALPQPASARSRQSRGAEAIQQPASPEFSSLTSNG